MSLPIAHLFVVASALLGCASGAVSGYHHSLVLAGLGAVGGFMWGTACFIGVTFPYVWCFTHVEMSGHVYSISKLARALFFPTMVVILVLATFVPWYAAALL